MKVLDDINFKIKARELINLIIKDKKALTRYGLAEGLGFSFTKIPFDVAWEYIVTLAKDRHSQIRSKVIDIVCNNIDAIPYEKVYPILAAGLDDRAASVRIDTIQKIRYNIDLHPINLLKKALETNRQLCNNSNWLINTMANSIYKNFFQKVSEIEENPSEEIEYGDL